MLYLFIALNPFPHITILKEICFYSASFIMLGSAVFKPHGFIFKTPLTVPLLLFSAWALISVIFANEIANSALDFYGHQIKYLLFYFLLINVCRTKRSLELLLWLIILSTTLFASGGLIYQYLIKGAAVSERFGSGFMEISTNLIVVVTGFGFICSLRHVLGKNSNLLRITAVLCCAVLLTVTLMTQSRAALIAIILATTIAFAKQWKLIVLFYLVLLMVMLVSPIKYRFNAQGISSIMNNVRISLNLINLKVMLDHPVVGIGYGNDSYGRELDLDVYNKSLPEHLRLKENVLSEHTKQSHNMYLSIGARMGIIGLLLYFYLMFSIIRLNQWVMKSGNNSWCHKLARCMLSVVLIFWVVGIFEQGLMHATEIVFYTAIGITTVLWKLEGEMAAVTPSQP